MAVALGANARSGSNRLTDVDDFLAQLGGRDLFIRETLTLLGDVPDVNGGFRAKLHAAQAVNAGVACMKGFDPFSMPQIATT